MAAQHHQAAGKPLPLKRLLVGTTVLPAAAFGLMMAFAPEASADIVYQFFGATATFTGPTVETITGTFDYNTMTDHVDSIAMTITGGYDAGYYNIINDSDKFGLLAQSTNSNTVNLFFAASLGLATSAALLTAESSNYLFTSSHVQGSADPVPEPSSLALLGAALGLFGLRRRQRWPSTGGVCKDRAA